MSNRIKPKRSGSAELHRSRRARIEQALAAGDIAGAAALAETALAQGQIDPMFLNLAAWRQEESGDFAAAHRLLRQALALAPGDLLIMGSIGAVLRKEHRLTEALTILDQVVTAEPRHAAAWLERGYTLEALKSENAAAESYQRAVALDPDLAPALGKLADIAARRGDGDSARQNAARALAVDPLQPSATFALATMEIEARDGTSAAARLERLLGSTLKDEDRTRSLTLLGDAFDRQDRPADAFRAWSEAQAIFRRTYEPFLGRSAGLPSHREFIDRIAAQVEDRPPMVRPGTMPPVEGAAAGHVFLLGYPRSGTTLVENILASAPEVVALEERETLCDTEGVLVANDGAMPDLDTIDPKLLAELRRKYWERVRSWAGDVEGKIFVDMNPLNGFKLPVIARLFPEARILIMRRDPRDVVLSCFRINFVPSPSAFAYSDLEETARHYDALMRLTELCRERLPLAYHEVRYDRLVADFETTVRALAEHIGLEWTEKFHAFDRTAKTRGVRTASATQVRKGLYDGGGRWRRYQEQLAPVLPILAPWVERFGFQP